MRTSSEALLVLLLVLGSSLAQAEEQAAEGESDASVEEPSPPSPEDLAYAQLVDDALREFGAGHYREAADNFREALAMRPSARVLRGLGKALFELGEYVEASAVFERALVHPVDPLTDALRSDVEGLLARSERHIGSVVIEVNVAEAELLLDGRTVASGTLRLDAGEHELQARAEGHEPLSRTVAVVAGERQVVDLVLEPRAAPSVTVVNEARSARPVAGGVLTGVGVAGAVAAAFWLRDRISAAEACPTVSDTAVCTNGSRIVAERRAAGVALGLGLAAAVTGAVLLLLPGDAEDSDAVTFGCGPRGRGASCSVGGTF